MQIAVIGAGNTSCLYGSNFAVCAITGLRPGHIREVPEVDEFQTQIIQEALALVKAKGITLPEKDPLGTIKEYCAKKFHKVSMVQHLESEVA